jgi:hypothetical protein
MKDPKQNTHALMHGRTELLRGDHTSISVIYRNLTGQNRTSAGYLEMMNKNLKVTIKPDRLSIKTL